MHICGLFKLSSLTRYLIVLYLCAVSPLGFTPTSEAAVNDQIAMFLETPAQGQTITGVLFTRGWAVAPMGIARIELYIDGEFQLNMPIGEHRPDVAARYPPDTYPGSANSGFNIALFYSRYGNGAHTATVRAVDNNDDFKEISVDFIVTRFDTSVPNNFIRDLSKIDYSQALVGLNGDTITLTGLVVDGMGYDVELQWNTTLQGIGIAKITPAGGGGPLTPGLWLGVLNPTPPLILICFNVSADGTRLTAEGSPCDTETIPKMSLGIEITDLDNCEAELETSVDIAIANNTFSHQEDVGNQTLQVSGTFQLPTVASGTVQVINNDRVVLCEGSWLATPFSGE